MNPKFGLLVYNGTDNLGDEIQSIAARRFLPSVDYQFDRDSISIPDHHQDEIRLIMNGWFMKIKDDNQWPPPQRIKPLLTSFHITPGAKPKIVLSKSGLDFLKRNGPVGCRDFYTLGILRRNGVESFFSACLTLTLDRPNVERDKNLIVANGVSPAVLERLRKLTAKKIVTVTQGGYAETDIAKRFEKAESLLQIYARASCVITTKLHCAMPSLAMQTPVLLINSAPDTERFFGLNSFVYNCTEFDFLDPFKFYYDFENPIANPSNYLQYRQALIESVTKFVEHVAAPTVAAATAESYA